MSCVLESKSTLSHVGALLELSWISSNAARERALHRRRRILHWKKFNVETRAQAMMQARDAEFGIGGRASEFRLPGRVYPEDVAGSG